jgi:hypothetical protein
MKIKHSWINYPTKSIQKCTRCGIIRKCNRDGNYGNKFYAKNGVELKENPDCKQ